MLFLGIDGGATAAKWSIRDAHSVIASGRSLPLDGHIYRADSKARMEAFFAEISTKVDAQKVSSIYAGLTGLAESESDRLKIREIATTFFPRAKVTLALDVELAYKAHLTPGEGILLYAGTGSIAVHLDRHGKWKRVGGWGYLLGDEGAGYWIGREGIRHTILCLESEREDQLSRAVCAALGATSWGEIRTAIYGGDRSLVASIAEIVAEESRKGDSTAGQILVGAAEHLSDLISRMDSLLGYKTSKIIFAGGIARQVPEVGHSLAKRHNQRLEIGERDIAEAASILAMQ